MSRIAVLLGGGSLEREVSLRSGRRVEEALRQRGHDVVQIDAGPQLVAELRSANPDACFVALHGRDGEDGTVQGLLEVLGIPYTGSGVAACARCTDKVQAKHRFVEAGIPTPAFCSFTETAFRSLGAGAALGDAARMLGYPVVVKPADQGSGLGLGIAHDDRQLAAAIVSAFSYSPTVLLEEHVAGRELAVSVLDRTALPIVEPELDGRTYDFAARYDVGHTRWVCPAALEPELATRAQELATQIYDLLGCRDVARVDLLCGDGGELTALEADVIPGLTETSLLPQAAEAAGIGFDELVDRLVGAAIARGRST